MRSTEYKPIIIIKKKLSSVRLTIFLLFALAGLSIIGTLVQQNLQPIEYIQRYGFRLYRILNFFGIFDLYHTWWFTGMLLLLAINLLVCSFVKFPGVLKLIRQQKLELSESQMRGLPFFREFKIERSPEAQGELYRYLRSLGGRLSLRKINGESIFVLEKGLISRLGPYVTHLGIVIILIGALVGSIYGFRANVRIVEGESINRVYESRKGREIHLGFDVKCEDFAVEFYPGMGERPKRFASDLRIIENGQQVAQKVIEVNSPLTYKGLTFYQSDYGPASPPRFDILVYNLNSGEKRRLILGLDQKQVIGENVSIMVVDYSPDYMGFGPTALIVLHENSNSPARFPVFQNLKDFDAHSGRDYRVELTSVLKPDLYYTGLQVTRDPGVNIVWLGSFILCTGLTLAFFFYHRMVFIRVREDKDSLEVLVGGMPFKNKLGFEREFSRITTHLENWKGGKE